jgi:MFS family permease
MSGGMSLIAETHPAAIRGTAIGLAYSGLAIGVLCGPLLGGSEANPNPSPEPEPEPDH